MLVALAADEVAVRVVDVRPLELPALHLELERRQVRAGEVRREIGGGEQERAVGAPAHAPSIGRPAVASYVSGCFPG